MKSFLPFWMEITVSLEKAKNGSYTLKRGNKYLHSIYNPRKEAEQQVERFKVLPDSICLCIEPLLGYILDALKDKLGPKGKILLVELDDECSAYRLSHNKGSKDLRCSSLNNFSMFLESYMNEINMDRFRLISITQSERLYPEEHKKILTIWKSNIERLRRNRLNSRYMGPSRIRNTLNSLRFISSWSEMTQEEEGDVLLVAPGPSLEDHIELLKDYSGKLYTFALSSAVHFLQYNHIDVDAVFTSDPGYWASFHFRHTAESTPVIMPLSAHLDAKANPAVLVPVKEDQYISGTILPEESLCIPDFATVAATALYWLARKVRGRIYVAGLDLSSKDICSHARPYSFDNMIEGYSNRLAPLHQQYYHRHYLQDPDKKRDSPLDIYRKWFLDNREVFGDKLISITPSLLPMKKASDKDRKARGNFSQWKIQKLENISRNHTHFIELLENETLQLMKEPPEEWNPNQPMEELFYQWHPDFFLQKDVNMDNIIRQLPLWLNEIKEKLNVILG